MESTRNSFAWALDQLKGGRRVARSGWNGKGMWVELQRPDAGSKMTLPYLFIEYPVGHPAYPNGCRVPWLASQTDLLADDWVLVGLGPASEEEGHWVVTRRRPLKMLRYTPDVLAESVEYLTAMMNQLPLGGSAWSYDSGLALVFGSQTEAARAADLNGGTHVCRWVPK